MKGSRVFILCAVLIFVTAVMCSAANHYTLGGWRNWSGPENGQPGPGYIGNAFMRVFVLDELGRPVPGARVWFQGVYYGLTKTTWQLTDDRGHVEYGFEFAGSPCKIWVSDNVNGATSTTDTTPEFYNHDNHRAYDILFVKSSSVPGWTADASYCGNLLDMNSCPSTASLIMNTPLCSDYYSGARDLGPAGTSSFGQTFVADTDRAMVMRAHLTKGFMTIWRWSAQIFEGGPDGPPMGPKRNLKHNYISDDIKYFLSYGTEECALKPGNTYYVKFTAADGSDINAYRCTSDVYPDGMLYENGLPVPGMDLQCQVLGITSGNTNVGTVTGMVTNEDGQPVNEAIVTFGDRTILTGRLGTYKCYNVVPGVYNVTVTAPGYEATTVTNREVTVGGTLTTDVVLQKTAGPISIVSTSSAQLDPGDMGVPMSMTVANTSDGDCFVNYAYPTFWDGASNVSNYFSVTPDAANPTVIRGNSTVTFNFLVDCAAVTPSASYTVQGVVDAYVNLQANGSFEADSYIPDYTGPSGWDWNSEDPPSVARLSYQQGVLYKMPGGSMSADVTKSTIRWIGAWSDAGSKKQGFKLYSANGTGGAWKLRFDIRFSDDTMEVATGTPDVSNWSYPFSPGKYYQIDAWVRASDGRFQVDIIPLQEQKTPGHCEGQASASTDTPRIEWGKMYSSGEEEMSCREFSYWLDGPTPTELHWYAINGFLPSDESHPELGCGWGMEGGSPGAPYEAMLPGAPWSADSQFEVTTLDSKDGSQCLRVMCSPSDPANSINLSTGNSGWLAEYNRMQVKPMTTYQLSFWYKQTQYTVNPANLRVLWEEYDSAGNRYYYEPNGAIGYRPPFHWDEREPVSHGEWRYRTYTFTTGLDAATAEILLRMDKPSNDSVADVFWLDDFRFMELNSYADLTVDSAGTVEVGGAVEVASIADAKSQPDGTVVIISDVIVTGSPVGEPNNFYIEEANRASGIKVVSDESTGVSEGDVVDVQGTLDTVNGERVLVDPTVTVDSSGTALKSLALNGKALGGGPSGYTPGVEAGLGPNNVGLLVTVAGQINNAGAGYLYVDDGSGLSDGTGTGVKVILDTIPMETGKTFVTVTGFSSVENGNGSFYRVIRPRAAGDIVWY